MRPASTQQSGYLNHASFGSRATSFALSVAVVLLLVFMLVKLGALPFVSPPKAKPLTLLQLPPEQSISPTHEKAVAKTRHAAHNASSHAAVAVASPPPPPTPPKPPVPWMVTPLTTEELASADIGTKPSRSDRATVGDPASGNGSGKDSVATYGPGEGPGGEQLFDPDWYSKPTDAQLAYYLPKGGAPEGWAMIACQTVEKYHVDNCHELGETPGSGLARALRQAAWQFLVRPPRIGGRPMIGAWVRIRFDFNRYAAK